MKIRKAARSLGIRDKKLVQAKHIHKGNLLTVIGNEGDFATTSFLQEVWPTFPAKVLLARLRAFEKQGLIVDVNDGCAWALTHKGVAFLAQFPEGTCD